MGRPKKLKKPKPFLVHLSEPERKVLAILCPLENKSQSALIRAAIIEYGLRHGIRKEELEA